MLILLAILWFAGVLWWDVSSDYKKWQKNIPVQHTEEALWRALLLAPALVGFSLPHFHILNMLMAAGMMFSWWWEFFDGLYNKKRNLAWRFNGSHDPDDSALDSFLYHLSAHKQMLLKWGLIILFTTLYILT